MELLEDLTLGLLSKIGCGLSLFLYALLAIFICSLFYAMGFPAFIALLLGVGLLAYARR